MSQSSSLPKILAIVLVSGAAFGAGGFWIGTRQSPPPPPAPEPPVAAVEPEQKKEPAITDADIDKMLAELAPPAEVRPEPSPFDPPGFDPAAMEERQKRWDSMSQEQRQLFRKSLFSALAKVDGLEEVGDAIREGRVDPRQFQINPEAIADRMEFYAESMDSAAMEEEVTLTLQNIVDQARSQSQGKGAPKK